MTSFKRPPDVLIGDPLDPYLRRWHVVPRNRVCNVYLHHFRRDDDKRALHDHPWPSLSVILRGGYTEVTTVGRRWYGRGSVIIRRALHTHRLEVGASEAWTLFVTGPHVREWGFHCRRGWVHWRQFADADNPGAIGRGCGELA